MTKITINKPGATIRPRVTVDKRIKRVALHRLPLRMLYSVVDQTESVVVEGSRMRVYSGNIVSGQSIHRLYNEGRLGGINLSEASMIPGQIKLVFPCGKEIVLRKVARLPQRKVETKKPRIKVCRRNKR